MLKRAMVAAVIVCGVASLPAPIQATHAWRDHHWRRTSSAIREIPTRRMLSSVWLARFTTAMADWHRGTCDYVRL